MRFRRSIRLVLVASMVFPMPFVAGGQVWGALGVPMQPNGPLLEQPSEYYHLIWHRIDENRHSPEYKRRLEALKRPPSERHPFLNDLSLDEFK